MTMWGVAGLCRTFLSTLNDAKVHGLEEFTELLDSRQNVSQRSKGLITGTEYFPSQILSINWIQPLTRLLLSVSNHISVYVPTEQREFLPDLSFKGPKMTDAPQ